MPFPSRRTLLAAALGAPLAGLLSGCPADDPAVPSEDPDARLVDRAVVGLASVVALAQDLGRGAPRRARALAPTLAAHRAHLDLLQPGTGAARSPRSRRRSFRGDDQAAFRAMADAEHRLTLTMQGTALRADSGALARVLAGIAAACAQQEALLRRRA